jgi:hypothetical protein
MYGYAVQSFAVVSLVEHRTNLALQDLALHVQEGVDAIQRAKQRNLDGSKHAVVANKHTVRLGNTPV